MPNPYLKYFFMFIEFMGVWGIGAVALSVLLGLFIGVITTLGLAITKYGAGVACGTFILIWSFCGAVGYIRRNWM